MTHGQPELYRYFPFCQERLRFFRSRSGLWCAAMAEPDLRLQVSLRLKAARMLAGHRATEGRQSGSAIALTTAELAASPLVKANGIKRNRIEEIEQMKADARPMELAVLAEALKVPRSFLTEPLEGPPEQLSAEDLVDRVRGLARQLELLLNQQGRDVGRRDLESARAAGRSPRPRPVAASGSQT